MILNIHSTYLVNGIKKQASYSSNHSNLNYATLIGKNRRKGNSPQDFEIKIDFKVLHFKLGLRNFNIRLLKMFNTEHKIA